MNTNWEDSVLINFDNAAHTYNKNAIIQRNVAWELSTLCSKQVIPKGLWLDLGSGTGLLAESLESLHTNQQVLRIDSSQQMIDSHPKNKQKQIWNLNSGLPNLPQPPQLIASSFVLHWLNNPPERVSEWFNALDNDGWLALAIPVKGSFKEWYEASDKAKVPCTAIKLPSANSLVNKIKAKNIRHNQSICITQTARNLQSLFKTMINVGAQSSHQSSLKLSEWKRLRNSWPLTTSKEIHLTWLIQILLIQK